MWEAISTKALFSGLAGLFSLVLGVFALLQNPRYRLNRSYAFYCFTLALLQMPGLIINNPLLDHHAALMGYRLIQLALPVSSYFLICFIQEFGGVYDEKNSIRWRRLIQVLFVALAPFYLTGFVIRDFAAVPQGNDVVFTRQAGALYPVNILIYLVLMTVAAVTTINRLWKSTGFRRNQMWFVAAGLFFGFWATVFYFLSFTVSDIPWIYHPLQMAMSFCFAFAMYKHNLFEFDLWMRRAAIYTGIYLAIASVPVFLFFPLRNLVPVGQPSQWTALTLFALGYGALFAMAPLLTGYVREKTEKKKLGYLNRQLETVRDSSEHLSDESGLTADEIGNRILRPLRNFYWEQMKTPLAFLVVALKKNEAEIALAAYPDMNIDDAMLTRFMDSLQALPSEFLKRPFGLDDIEKKFQAGTVALDSTEFNVVKNYLAQNAIEACAPCVHNDRLAGVILLGSKKKGILWREELNAIHLAAGHAATAMRKSELLSHNRELRDLDRLKTELIHNITHEFKTPLQVVENAMEILMKDIKKGSLDPKKVGDYLLMVKNNAGMLAMFIQNLLEVSRIEQSKVDLKPRRADLNEIIASAFEFVKPLGDQKGLAMEFHRGDPIRFNADVEKLHQVFCNLLSNAVKFTDEGRVAIEAVVSDGRATVRVQDTGRGIEPQYLTAVFEKFFQVPSGENLQKEGTGLGLAIAHGWVEAHGGTIRAESPGLGKGTTFTVELPI